MISADHRLLFHGGAFAAVGPSGDITGVRGPLPDGLFLHDARHLSRWQLTVDGTTPTVLVPATAAPRPGAGTAPEHGSARCVLIPAAGRGDPPPYTVFREQRVADGALVDVVRIVGSRAEPEKLWVALTVDADFADQFELRSDHRVYDKPHAVRTRQEVPDGVEFGYRRGEWQARTAITAEPPPDAVEQTGSGARRLVWHLELEPHGSAELTLRATAPPVLAPEGGQDQDQDQDRPRSTAAQGAAARPAGAEGLGALLEGTGSTDLVRAGEQGLADLEGLLIPAAGPEGETVEVPAAGVPWFLALVGRQALLTSLFALRHRPSLACATLLALAATQAEAADGEAAESGKPGEPLEAGKIVHEVRHGELAHFGQVPYGRYYGAVDTTPLFLVALGAFTERTGDDKLARRLERHARAAVDWMFRDGGLEDRGYLRYRPDGGGLANQSWKDSPGAICFADGERASGAIAAAAPQGYAYDALRRTARLAGAVWDDPALADRLTAAADGLRERFLADFWLPGQDFPALALDGEDRPVDALASDAGHLLWSGLLGREQAERVGRRLLEPDFFSGWGVRTLAAGQRAYHPLSYHCGTVWPHDNAVIALGLARYGLRAEARAVGAAIGDLAAHEGYRLPEVIAGYARTEHPAPVPYPHACTPQSWAASAPLALLTAAAG